MSKGIEYKKVEIERELLFSIFPKEILESIGTKKPFVYGALDEKGILIGALLLTVSNHLERAVQIHYVIVNHDFRNDGIGSGLISKAIESANKAGVRYIHFRQAQYDVSKLLKPFDFASDNGFVPIAADNKVLYYRLETILVRSATREMVKIKREMTNMVRIRNKKDPRIYYFDQIKEHGVFRIGSTSYNPEFSGFLVHDGVITGSALCKKTDDYLIINDIFLEPETDRISNYKKLVAFCITQAVQDIGIQGIYIQINGEDRKKAVEELLGKADQEEIVIELLKYL